MNDARRYVLLSRIAAILIAVCCASSTVVAQTEERTAPVVAEQPAAATPAPDAPSTSPREKAEPVPDAAAPRDELLFPPNLQAEVRKHQAQIDQLGKSLERVKNDDGALETLRPEIVALEADADRLEGELAPKIEIVERLISELGDKPKDGEAPETPAIAAERQRLETIRQQLLGGRQLAGLTKVRAGQLVKRIHSLRLQNLGRNLTTRQAHLFSTAYWTGVAGELPRFGKQMRTVAENWWSFARERIHWLFLILMGAGCLWWGLWAAGKSQVRAQLRDPLERTPPAYLSRVSMAVRTLPFLLAPGLATAVFLYLALWASGLFNDQIDGLALSALKAAALFMLANALAKAILLPWNPSWRLIGLPTPDARRYLWLIRLLAGVYCLDLWLDEMFAALQVPESIAVGASVVTNLLFAALLFAFAWRDMGTDDASSDADEKAAATAADPIDQMPPDETVEPAAASSRRTSARLMQKALLWLRLPATLAVVAICVATLLGYVALGRFIAGQVMLVGIGAAAMLLGHLGARALATQPQTLTPGLDNALEDTFALSAKRRQQTFGVMAFLLNVTLAVAAAALLLLSWGFSDAELFGWASSLMFGFEIGKFKFSLLQILIAVALFGGIIVLTRMVQGWLSRRILDGERMDRGIANSIHSGVGYAGVAIAALIGVSYAGVDLSNIALIASALSIGIGFGLNAIASNFVSGLIMLIERPVKVGDWVVVGAHEGFVRRISVRATEIETFDRASVIVPNSDFMTSPVQNWTHRNAMGRVVVNIGASYQADPEHVMTVLQGVARDSDVLLNYPAPSVHFEEFGASSLDFSVRGFVADVTTSLSARTTLRLAIAKALREADIEIPFPQQDVHLRDLDGVREMVAIALANRAQAGQAPPQNAMPPGNDNSDGDGSGGGRDGG